MIISLIVAMAENRVIGRDGDLPWHLPEDLKHFARTTAGKPVIMGRKTFESMGEPLPGRTNVIITRNAEYAAEGAIVTHSLDEALAEVADAEEVFILGGSDIFRMAMPRADRFYLTLVHGEVEGDTYFPQWDQSRWKLVDERVHDADERHAHAMSFRLYERD